MLVGDDWRPLVRDAAMEMADRTGLAVSGCCTSVYAGDLSDPDDSERLAIERKAGLILDALADERSQLTRSQPATRVIAPAIDRYQEDRAERYGQGSLVANVDQTIIEI